MSSLLEQLREHPDEVVNSTIDDDARALLQEFGLLAKFDKQTTNSGPLSRPSGANIQLVGHPTHWICVTRFFGCELPADNGFITVCFPKSRVTRAEFDRHMEAEQREDFPEGYIKQHNDDPFTGTN